jgi:hypothetical protein
MASRKGKTRRKAVRRAKSVKKSSRRAKSSKKKSKRVKSARKRHFKAQKGRKRPSKPKLKRRSLTPRRVIQEIILPKKLPVKPRKVVIVYGMSIDPEKVTRAAIEAYNKRKYTVHDIRLVEYIPDPKFNTHLMVKIAVLDRIEEEMLRLYPEAEVIRPNTVTLKVR